MKSLFVLMLALSMGFSLADNSVDNSENLLSGDERDAVLLAKGPNNVSLRTLATQMCLQLQASRTTGHSDTGERVEFYILNFLGITRSTEGYKLQVTTFWNSNAQYLLCDDNAQGLTNPALFMKRVVEMEMQKTVLYGFLLSDEEDYPITVNHVEIHNGKEETLLDFLDAIVDDETRHRDYDIDEIQELREVLIDFYDAKNARNLDSANTP